MPFLNFETDRSRQEARKAIKEANEKAKHTSEIEEYNGPEKGQKATHKEQQKLRPDNKSAAARRDEDTFKGEDCAESPQENRELTIQDPATGNTQENPQGNPQTAFQEGLSPFKANNPASSGDVHQETADMAGDQEPPSPEARTPRSQSPSRQGRPEEREELSKVPHHEPPKQLQRNSSKIGDRVQVPEKQDSTQQTTSGSRTSKPDEIRFLDHRRKCTLLIQEYLNHERGHLHLSRTLDQFYYSSIDTTDRPKTQVVYDFSKKYQTSERSIPLIKPQRGHNHPSHFSQLDSKEAGKATRASKEDSNRSTAGLPAQEPHTEKANASQKSTVPNQNSKEVPYPSNYSTKPKPPMDSENPKKFTVDQLWLWIMDESTFSN
jgi:hypothetical protein